MLKDHGTDLVSTQQVLLYLLGMHSKQSKIEHSYCRYLQVAFGPSLLTRAIKGLFPEFKGDSDRQPMGRFGNWNEFHQPGGISDGDVAEIRLDFGVIKSVHASNCLLSSILSLIHQYHQLCCFPCVLCNLKGFLRFAFDHLPVTVVEACQRSLLSDAEGRRRTQGGASVTLQLAEGTKVSRGIPSGKLT